eukprot:g13273.t1
MASLRETKVGGWWKRPVMDESPTDRGNLAKAKRRIKQEQQKIQLPRSSVIARILEAEPLPGGGCFQRWKALSHSCGGPSGRFRPGPLAPARRRGPRAGDPGKRRWRQSD